MANAPEKPVRIAKDPRDSSLYILLLNGDIHHLEFQGESSATLSLAHAAAEHGQESAQGFAIGPDGAFYIVGNEIAAGRTESVIMRGVPDGAGGRTWSTVARTDSYPRSNTAFDHVFNAVAVSPDGQQLYVNSGSRTDHGEVQSASGKHPGMREISLTARIFRLPADGTNIRLENDENQLRQNGYVFAEGVRNAFSLAFDRSGNLFSTENGPDRDNSDALLWLREGRHYGFPWRLGGEDNPQQFPDYDPAADHLLNADFIAVSSGFYHNDPTFPAPPSGVTFTDPIINYGPDAASYRDPETGAIRDGAAENRGIHSFTSHRSPLGLVFDTRGALAAPYRFGGFVLGWNEGDPDGDSVAGPFRDPGQDLLHLDLRLRGDNYEMNARRIVEGFSNPVDAEIIGNRIYVVEFGGDYGIWEITLPGQLALQLREATSDALWFRAVGPAGASLRLEYSPDLENWETAEVLENPSGEAEFARPVPAGARGFFRLHPVE